MFLMHFTSHHLKLKKKREKEYAIKNDFIKLIANVPICVFKNAFVNSKCQISCFRCSVPTVVAELMSLIYEYKEHYQRVIAEDDHKSSRCF